MSLFDQLHASWRVELSGLEEHFKVIEAKISGQIITPEYPQILRAFSTPIEEIRIVIVGQDPYPRKGHAHGLAFSVDSSVRPLPATLRNIFQELRSDCGKEIPVSGDLSAWTNQGVFLLNRILTTEEGESLAHKDFGWQEITDAVAKILGSRETIAILWGRNAQELATYFRDDLVIASAHPSPLSSYRGFFGSKPFSRANQLLEKQGCASILW
jgi:uracil-DNA glycosylase